MVILKKKWKILVLLFVVIALSVTIAMIVRMNRSVVFYDTILFDRVSVHHKEMAREIYSENKDIISRILVAEANRSNQLIKWVFISDETLSAQEERTILDAIFENLQPPRTPRFPLIWEVYFCSDERVNSAFVSRYGYGPIVNSDCCYFREWESVLNVGDMLSYDVLTKVMLRNMRARPMYERVPHPIAEMTPYIPKYR